VLLYELLAGARPYDVIGRSPEEITRIVTGSDLVRPSVMAARTGDDALPRRWRFLPTMYADTAMDGRSWHAAIRGRIAPRDSSGGGNSRSRPLLRS
jgi:hypothetical protein